MTSATPLRVGEQVFTRNRAIALALTVSGVALVGGGVMSSWNLTTSVSSGDLNTASGAVTLLDANGGTFSSGIANLLPGDYFYRYIDVRNDGTLTSSFTGTVNVTGDLTGQVTVAADTCSLPWTTVAGLSTCVGTTAGLGSGTPTASTPVTVSHGTIAPGALGTQHVRYKFTFASSAPTTLEGKDGGVTINVAGNLTGGSDRTSG